MNAEEIAQWVIDNRYPKMTKVKVSDLELYDYLVERINDFANQPKPDLMEHVYLYNKTTSTTSRYDGAIYDKYTGIYGYFIVDANHNILFITSIGGDIEIDYNQTRYKIVD